MKIWSKNRTYVFMTMLKNLKHNIEYIKPKTKANGTDKTAPPLKSDTEQQKSYNNDNNNNNSQTIKCCLVCDCLPRNKQIASGPLVMFLRLLSRILLWATFTFCLFACSYFVCCFASDEKYRLDDTILMRATGSQIVYPLAVLSVSNRNTAGGIKLGPLWFFFTCSVLIKLTTTSSRYNWLQTQALPETSNR